MLRLARSEFRLLLTLAFFMAVFVTASNFLVQFPINFFGMQEVLTYGAISYPITFLITDLSSTAYTYAFATEKPVIFYSPNEKSLKKNKFLSFYYFIDRSKIGITLTKFNQIKKKLIYFQKQKLIYKKRIISLRNQIIEYFNKSLMRTKKIINYL